MIYTPQPLNSSQNYQRIEVSTTSRDKTNIYTLDHYDNEILTDSTEICTIQYRTINYSNNVKIENRARVKTYRGIEDDVYSAEIILMTKIYTDITLDYTTIKVESNPIAEIYYNYSNYITYYSDAETTTQQQFIEGKNYNSYMTLNQVNLTYDATQETTATYPQTNVVEETYNNYSMGNQDHYITKINYVYDSGYIVDNGASLLDNNFIIGSINIILDWTPTPPSGGTYEVIDIAGLMFQILGMPFAWISMAFNFTLFPNTPYAVNISHLLLGLIVSLIAIVIFRIIMGAKS